jgi:Skp1 family, dimerisation domain
LLFDLVAAANYMNIKPLLDLACLAVSIMIKGKSAQELRTIFKIEAEMTDEERAQIDRENAWVAESGDGNDDNIPENGANNNNAEVPRAEEAA